MKRPAAVLLSLILICGILHAADNYVTVYNNNLALVKQIRSVEMPEAGELLRFTDVAEQLIPTSVHLRPVSGRDFQVLEQNFEYDLVSADKILE
ncbi:MAG: DUF4139 domain-containing protein, partial [Calditrichia bacterium]